jgi:hypothetical protein
MNPAASSLVAQWPFLLGLDVTGDGLNLVSRYKTPPVALLPQRTRAHVMRQFWEALEYFASGGTLQVMHNSRERVSRTDLNQHMDMILDGLQ